MQLDKINSHNHWDTLRTVILGSVEYAKIPKFDKSTWAVNYVDGRTYEEFLSDTTLPYDTKYPDWVYETDMEDLNNFEKILKDLGVEVLRPEPLDTSTTISNGIWEQSGYEYRCPRDSILVVGNKVIECAMSLRARYFETYGYRKIFMDYFDNGVNFDWITPPKPFLSDSTYDENCGKKPSLLDTEILFDAANVLRCGRDLFFQISNSGNMKGLKWLQQILGNDYKVHPVVDTYNYTHLDSTILGLKPGCLLVNRSRLKKKENLPKLLQSWDLIWIEDEDIVDIPTLDNYAPASIYNALNVMSYDQSTVFVESTQTKIMKKLERGGFDCIPVKLQHTRTLAGGPHCVTADLCRDSKLESYF